MQDVGPDATSHAEQAGLFPAQPDRTTVEHARAGDDLEAERLVADPVGRLARDDDLGPRAGRAGERPEQGIEITPDSPAVCGQSRRVDQHANHDRKPHRDATNGPPKPTRQSATD